MKADAQSTNGPGCNGIITLDYKEKVINRMKVRRKNTIYIINIYVIACA